jgi:hypothetical protein
MLTREASTEKDTPLVANSIVVFAAMDRLHINMDRDVIRNIALGQREGQAWFNALQKHAPDLAEIIRGTKEDPFNDDRAIPAFLKAIFGKAEFNH